MKATRFLILMLALAGIPLVILPGLLFFFDVTPKAAIAAGTAALCLVHLAAGSDGVRKVLRDAESKPVLWLFAIELVAVGAAAVRSPSWALALLGSDWRQLGFVSELALLILGFWLFVQLCSAPAVLRTVLSIVSAAGVLVSLYTIVQYFGYDPLQPAALYRTQLFYGEVVRPPATLGHALYLAPYLVVVCFLGARLAMTVERPGHKWLGRAAAALGAIALILSGTRSGLVGLLTGSVLMVWLARPRISRRGTLIGALAAVVLTVALMSPLAERLRTRTEQWVEDAAGGTRLLLWRDTVRMCLQQPLWGYGLETFALFFPCNQSEELARAFPNHYNESAHNIVLDAWAERGAVGLLSTLAFFLAGAWLTWRRPFTTTSRKTDPCAAGLAGWAGLFVCLQFSAYTIPAKLMTYLLFALALAAPGSSLATQAIEPRSNSVAGRESSDSVYQPGAWTSLGGRAAVRVLAACGAIVLTAWAAVLCGVDFAYARAGEFLRQDRHQEAIAAYVSASAWRPKGGAADLWFARQFTQLAHRIPSSVTELKSRAFDVSFRAARKAIAHSETPALGLYALAQQQAAVGDLAAASESLFQAIAAAPLWHKPHWALGEVLFAMGRHQEAEAEASAAVTLSAGTNLDATQLHERIRSRPGRPVESERK